MNHYHALVVGGGFYGGRIAQHLAERGARVRLVESESSLMMRASYGNQARIHNGYHYPRSVVTALRSRTNAPRFVEEYADCISTSARMIYAIARRQSNVRASQFTEFCRRIGATVSPAPPAVGDWFDSDFIEQVFEVWEPVFDAVKLRSALSDALRSAGVEVTCSTRLAKLHRPPSGPIQADLHGGAGPEVITADRCFNCTYAGLNAVLHRAGAPPIALKHEWTEMALVRVPESLQNTGVTVMDGPFFSILPFPPNGLHTLSHVRYTPHAEWHDGGTAWHDNEAFRSEAPQRTNFEAMRKDASRFLPALAESEYVDSIWEVKTVLPKSEVDDGRPILFQQSPTIPGLYSILGSKIDNAYDVLTEVDRLPGIDTLTGS